MFVSADMLKKEDDNIRVCPLLKKTLECSLDSKEIKSVNHKGNLPENSLEEMKLKLKL